MKTLLYKEWITQKKIISLCGMFIILFCGVINGFLNKEQYFYIGSQFLYGFSLVFCRLQVFLYNINM
ncbi:hypothetical protein [Clostridium sp.]|uniref:hypothetical protein n=1 Tax=Clostridium sp. TaxID=1506 RepID=UPI003463FE15